MTAQEFWSQGWLFWGVGRCSYRCFRFQDFRKQNKTAPEVNGVAMSQPDWTPGNSPWASGEGGVHMSTAVWLKGCLVLGGGGSGGGATCLSPGWV